MNDRPSKPGLAGRLLAALHGIGLMLSATLGGLAAWFVLIQLAGVAERQLEQGQPVEGIVRQLVDHPARILVLAGAALLCGVALMVVRRGRWLWFAAGLSFMLGLVGLVLYCFLTLIGSLYEYQPL